MMMFDDPGRELEKPSLVMQAFEEVLGQWVTKDDTEEEEDDEITSVEIEEVDDDDDDEDDTAEAADPKQSRSRPTSAKSVRFDERALATTSVPTAPRGRASSAPTGGSGGAVLVAVAAVAAEAFDDLASDGIVSDEDDSSSDEAEETFVEEKPSEEVKIPSAPPTTDFEDTSVYPWGIKSLAPTPRYSSALRRKKAPVKPKEFSFDTAHPAIASKHYLRTKEQDNALRQSLESAMLSAKVRSFNRKKRNDLRSMSMDDVAWRKSQKKAKPKAKKKSPKKQKQAQERLLASIEREANAVEQFIEGGGPLAMPPGAEDVEEADPSEKAVYKDWAKIRSLESKISKLQSGLAFLKSSKDFKDFFTAIEGGGEDGQQAPGDRSSSEREASTSGPRAESESESESDGDSPSPKAPVRSARSMARPSSAPAQRPSMASTIAQEILKEEEEKAKDDWEPILTMPEPFSFQVRDEERSKRKTIAQAKLEQDLLLKQIEEDKMRTNTFKAKKIPKAVLEGRYEAMIRDQEHWRMMKHEAHREKMVKSEKPFTFYLVDKKRKEIKEKKILQAAMAAVKTKKFVANRVPSSTYEPRYELLKMEEKDRVGRIKERAKKKYLDAKMPPRMNQGQGTTEGQDFSPIPKAKGSKPLKSPVKKRPASAGQVPDYKKLHAEFEEKLANAKSKNVLKRTVIKEFNFGGKTKEEVEANQKRMEKRLKGMMRTMDFESEELTELRWPYLSRRGKYRRTDNISLGQSARFKAGETLAVRLRAAETRRAKENGQYDTREEKEARAERVRMKEAKRRAKAWSRMKKMHEEAAVDPSAGAEPATPPGGGSSAPSSLPAGSSETPSKGGVVEIAMPNTSRAFSKTSRQHVLARHKQVAERAAKIVEQALLQQGVDAYNFVKEDGPPQ